MEHAIYLNPSIEAHLKLKIHEVWSAIAHDCEFAQTNEEAVEMCIADGRLATFAIHGEDAAAFIRGMCHEHGFEATRARLSELIQLR